MRQFAAALVAVWGAVLLVSCVEVTAARKGEPAAGAQGGGQTTGGKAEVHVYAWNPFDDVVDVVLYPVKAVGKGLKSVGKGIKKAF